MKIGYDAKRAFLNNTGLGNYSRWLIQNVASLHPENQYLLYTPKLKANKWRNLFAGFSNIRILTPAGKLLTAMWRGKGIVRDLKREAIDLYHGLSYELPLGISRTGIKAVVSIHDLIFLRFPQYYKPVDRFIYKAKTMYAAKHADRIIAISERTKSDLVELLGVDPGKIDVVYQGCAPEFAIKQSTEKLDRVKVKYNLPNGFILNVGTIEERKNLLLLAKAVKHLSPVPPVVVVGKRTAYLDKVKAFLDANSITSQFTFLHDVSFEDLPAIYQLAGMFVYPSRYEGFGIPVLEALNSGVPVIAASGSCLEEAGGPLSRYINPDDDRELAAQIDLLLNDSVMREHMIKNGRLYAERFKDATLASQLMTIYQQLINNA